MITNIQVLYLKVIRNYRVFYVNLAECNFLYFHTIITKETAKKLI